MNRPTSLTVFFPACNDGGTIGSQVLSALQLLPQITTDYEVLIVNDGSRDHTADVLEELSRQYPAVRVVHHPQNRGYGAALRTGFAHARKEWVFYTDGDAQYDPHELVQLLGVWSPDVDLITGYKIRRRDPVYRIVLGWIYNRVTRHAFGLRVRDVDCDFRLIRRSVLDAVALESETGTICVEMVKKFQDAGCAICEVPVQHYHRTYGKSQFFQFRRLCRVTGQLVRLWWKLVIRRDHAKTLNPAPAASVRSSW
ncbi:MAG: Undecaprenyl-phosphate 4-deoxy-4-formamido-L-arabinose transferase [Verrucomicrobiae bacterium]|nr:Undecaprenyl-phosphate 4-deoxy-4-formamido-L-arabinose transferase [Verrucomicrobiae bacterium]